MTAQIKKPHVEMTWEDFEQHAQECPYAILPVGALEQHGPHLPIGTDIFIADHMAKKIAEENSFILLPALRYTPSFSLRKYPGTLRVSDEAFENQIRDIVESLTFHKIQYIYLIICHIGAIKACQSAERKLIDFPDSAKLVNIALPGLNEAMEKYCTSKRWHPSFVHAEEYETSAMLAIRPDLVQMEKAVKEYPPLNPLLGSISIGWDEFCKSGVIGDATKASAEKGHAILEFMTGEALKIIEKHQSQLR